MNQKSPDNKKVLITALISVVVVVLLGVTLYVGFSGKTAGRAIFSGAGATAQPGEAGFSGTIDRDLINRNEIFFKVGALLPANTRSVAYFIELRYDPAKLTFDPAFNDDGVRLLQQNEWGTDFFRLTSDAVQGKILLEYATLNLDAALQAENDLSNIAEF